jgi:ubiquinone/menaquinone biosynthesis C-methylase UbiE
MNGKLEAQKTWGASPTGSRSAKGESPGTIGFFEKARLFRDTIEQPWLPEVVPFDEMCDKRVLEIGFGPGYDTLKFMQARAVYSGIDITPENVARARQHLGFFGYAPDLQQGDAESLPFEDNSFDVVYSNGVLHHVPDIQKAFQEVFRVLRPGGEFVVLLYNKRSVFYAGVTLIHLATGAFLKQTLAERRSKIETTEANAAPIVNVFSRKEIANLLASERFTIKSIVCRKCTPEDLPASSRLGTLYKLVPQFIYDTIGRHAGWYLIARAVRPIYNRHAA